ncbi:MAG: xanthine dehydrogenase family protein molybdopterin-binding subunit [Thaumarchaeota archaeon]|nr:xanthine dehydrogenase family protein molybdopterin-binding subunit [Nitrososphaerota archaeon]
MSSTSQEHNLLFREKTLIGVPLQKVDSILKVTGKALYTKDVRIPDMLHARIKRCPYPHARILSIDTSKAEQIPGVRAIVTGKDFPVQQNEDTPALAFSEVLYANQSVVALAADNRRIAELALESIEVNYEPLPWVTDPEIAMTPGKTPTKIIHPSETWYEDPNVGRHIKVRKGDAAASFKKCDRVIEERYTTGMVSHFQLEPVTFVAQPDPDGGVSVWATSSGPHKTQYELSRYLGMEADKIRAKVPFLGGWFGSKEECHVAALCAKLALKADRPVKLELSREEMLTATGQRHPSVISVKDGINEDRKIVARQIRAIFNGGAYSSLGNNVVINAVLGAVSVYDIPNFHMDCFRVYTNEQPGTPMRGPIGFQIAWAIECQMERIANELGMDSIEFRLKNALKEGSENAIGELMESISHDKVLAEVSSAMKLTGHGKPRISKDSLRENKWVKGRGVALSAKWAPGGSPHQAMVRVKDSGKVEVWVDVVENGQGIYTGITQIVASDFGIPAVDVLFMPLVFGSDSSTSGLSGGASASRQLVNLGNAVLEACSNAKKLLAEQASKRLGVPSHDLDVRGGQVFSKSDSRKSLKISDLFLRAPIVGYRTVAPFTEGIEFVGYGTYYFRQGKLDPETGQTIGGRISPFYMSTAQVAEVSVNSETGQVRVEKIVAAADVGVAINPELAKGQIVGSVCMAMGAATSEELVFRDGKIINANLADYEIPSILDVPLIIPILVENPFQNGPFGAKSAGEPSMFPTAPAIRNAIHDAVGIWVNDLPITSERVLEAIQKLPNN